MNKKILTTKPLTEKQNKEANELLKFYKYIYLCKICGEAYGTDSFERVNICPPCENKLIRRKKAYNS